MTKPTICDLCGGPASGPVSVIVQSAGTVLPDQPTSTVSRELDACDACRETALRQLFEAALAQHQASIPVHRELIAVRAEEAELLAKLNDARTEGEANPIRARLADNRHRRDDILNRARQIP